MPSHLPHGRAGILFNLLKGKTPKNVAVYSGTRVPGVLNYPGTRRFHSADPIRVLLYPIPKKRSGVSSTAVLKSSTCRAAPLYIISFNELQSTVDYRQQSFTEKYSVLSESRYSIVYTSTDLFAFFDRIYNFVFCHSILRRRRHAEQPPRVLVQATMLLSSL